MSTITIPKKEYQELRRLAKRYETIVKTVYADIPEESLKEYKNAAQIRKAYQKSLRSLPR